MKRDLKILADLEERLEKFLALAKNEIHSKPWLVVVLMHEYYRNLYPQDPYLPFDKKISNTSRIKSVLEKNIEILKKTDYIKSYFPKITSLDNFVSEKLDNYKSKTKGKTQKVYDMLWKKFSTANYLKEAKRIIIDRFKNSKFNFPKLKGKTILDLGCGSGRYTIALTLLTGAKKVYGIDLDRESIKRCKKIVNKAGISNIEFKVADVLDIPFEDNFFDFIFCNGVLHHTLDMKKGMREFYRVLKPKSRAYLYLYGDGGIFWQTRKMAPKIMKKIPQEYTMAVLDIIGLPKSRFLFTDNWYVPLERHTTRKYLESYLKKIGFSAIEKIISGRPTDLDSVVALNHQDSKIIWGDGELRYFVEK